MSVVAEVERPTIPSEAKLIQQAVAGDHEAFGELYRLHIGAIQGQVYSRVEAADAPDLVQETFMGAFRKIETFEDRGQGIGPWLSTSARNRVISHYRKPGRVVVDGEGVLQKLDKTGTESFEDSVVDREIGRHALQDVMACLSDERKHLLYDIFFRNMDYEEYARRNGISVSAVKARVHRTRAFIRKALEVETVDDLLESY